MASRCLVSATAPGNLHREKWAQALRRPSSAFTTSEEHTIELTANDRVGYRHLDFAKVYGNQREVGAALKKALSKGDVKREDLFLVSKLWNTQHDPKDVEAALDDCLEELGLDYLDLYMSAVPFPSSRYS